MIELRLQAALRKAHASTYFRWRLEGTERSSDWTLRWEQDRAVITQPARFDGVTVLCTNVPGERLAAPAAMCKYRERVCVEQTIDFLKSPVQQQIWEILKLPPLPTQPLLVGSGK